MIKNMLFDFDGSIVNTRKLIIDLYNDIAEENNFNKIEETDLEYLGNLSYAEKAKHLNIPFYKIQYLFIRVLKNYKNHLSSIGMIDGMKEVLYKLKENNIRLGIISSNSAKTISEYFQKQNISIFDEIVSSKSLFGKDSSINKYINKYKLDKSETLYVGDEVRDILACKKCNLGIIAVTWGFDKSQALAAESPDFLVNSPEEIFEVLMNVEKNCGER
ncbi:MAG: HAD-IA family hydrolase [Bacillota bacterium]|nr:HAD-IA family hydrolase [Bacillota bacterium]